MIGLSTSQLRPEQNLPMFPIDPRHAYQNIPQLDLLTRQISLNPQMFMDQNPSCTGHEDRFNDQNNQQMPTGQNPTTITQQTAHNPYSQQNMTTQGDASAFMAFPSIYAQQQMPLGSKLSAKQSVPLGMDGMYAHQSLQQMSPQLLNNPKYDEVSDEHIHIETIETHSGMTNVKHNGRKWGRESETPDESKIMKGKGRKLDNEEETEEERMSTWNEIVRLQEEMKQMREDLKERKQGSFYKDFEKDRQQTKQENEKKIIKPDFT
jgi:hypothetical protein